jgi:hypothetical protein
MVIMGFYDIGKLDMPPKTPPKVKVPPGYEHSGRGEGG